jgi:hypothetical protein
VLNWAFMIAIGVALGSFVLMSRTIAQTHASAGSFVGLPLPTVVGSSSRIPDDSFAFISDNGSPRPPAKPALPAARNGGGSTLASAAAALRQASFQTAHPLPSAQADRTVEAAAAAPSTAESGSNSAVDGNQMPGPTIISHIHNAPGWQRNHTYTYATGPYTRVVNGLGWNEAEHSYYPGQPLSAYQLTSPRKCISAASGGPSGTGTAIEDGTCTWKYLSTVDYISLTGWAFDNQQWKKGTYHFFDYVTSGSPARAYALADDNCMSSTAPIENPGGQVSSPPVKFATNDGCHWYYMADILYSSGRSYVPTVTLTSSKSSATIQMKANYEAKLWNDRVYMAGENGERSPIVLSDKMSNNHGGGEGGALLGCEAPATGGDRSGRCHRLLITAAPGESFSDSLTPSDPLSGFNPTKGVAIYNDKPYRWPYEPAGILVVDPFVNIIGLQVKSVHGAAFFGYNQVTIRRSILEGGSSDEWTSHAAVSLDAGPCVVANSLIISHGSGGIIFKYPGIVLHATIVNPDRSSNSVGVETGNKWVYDDTTIADTAIFGFPHAGSSTNAETSFSPKSSSNMTDAPVDDSGTTQWMGTPGNYPVKIIPGTAYGASMVSAFVDPGRDWRTKNGGPLVGKGNAFGDFSTFCQIPEGARCANRTAFNFDSPDIIGTPRPQNGRYDIGASQSCSLASGKGDARRAGIPVSGQVGEGAKC